MQQPEHAIGRDGTAHVKRRGEILPELEVREDTRDPHVGSPIQHQPHGAFAAVICQQDDGLLEVRIGQASRRHEDLAGGQATGGAGRKLDQILDR